MPTCTWWEAHMHLVGSPHALGGLLRRWCFSPEFGRKTPQKKPSAFLSFI
jgi:hypothetical protein